MAIRAAGAGAPRPKSNAIKICEVPPYEDIELAIHLRARGAPLSPLGLAGV